MITLSISWGEMADSYTLRDETVAYERRRDGRGQQVAANRVRLPAAAVERILTWGHHRSARGWRPLLETPTLLYSDEAESLVYLVNVEIIVRPPALAAARHSWGETFVASDEPEPAAVGVAGRLWETATHTAEPPAAAVAAARWDETGRALTDRGPASTTSPWAETLIGREQPAFSFSRPREARPAAIWSARALPPWAGAGSAERRSGAAKGHVVRTWTAHVPPPTTT